MWAKIPTGVAENSWYRYCQRIIDCLVDIFLASTNICCNIELHIPVLLFFWCSTWLPVETWVRKMLSWLSACECILPRNDRYSHVSTQKVGIGRRWQPAPFWWGRYPVFSCFLVGCDVSNGNMPMRVGSSSKLLTRLLAVAIFGTAGLDPQ